MLLDAFSRVLRNEIASYAFVVDAKDDKAAQFYQRYRFKYLVDGAKDCSSQWPRSPNCFRRIQTTVSSARQEPGEAGLASSPIYRDDSRSRSLADIAFLVPR